jgi:excinuclease UvrABC nuclease subunit
VLSYRLEFHPENDEQFFEQLPSAPAVFALRGEQAQAEAYISKTANLRRRARRLLGQPASTTIPTSADNDQMWGTKTPVSNAEPTSANNRQMWGRSLNLRHRARWLEYSPTGSDFESGFLLYKLWRHEFPEAYQKRLRLRPAPLLRLILENRYPRLVITTRIAGLHGRKSAASGAFAFAPAHSAYYGPFPTRAAAEKFANDTLDLFKVRRCIEELNPDPAFPGCIYSEMKMCLAPCFRGCTDEAYAEEVAQLERFLASGGRSLLQAVAAERDRASEQLEFEAAAATHTRFERIQALTRELPEIVRRLDRLRGLMVQPSAQPGAVALFRIEEGKISDPVSFAPAAQAAFIPAGTAAATAAAPLSMEARLREAIALMPPAQLRSAQEAMEHLAMLKRWYYRTYKAGELFLSDERGELPMRRIVRGVARVLKGEAPPEDQGIGNRD